MRNLTEKEKKDIRRLKWINVAPWTGVIFYLSCIVYFYIKKRELIAFIQNQERPPVITKEQLVEAVNLNWNVIALMSGVFIVHLLVFIIANSKFRKLIAKLINQ